jgi:hypothetical protein
MNMKRQYPYVERSRNWSTGHWYLYRSPDDERVGPFDTKAEGWAAYTKENPLSDGAKIGLAVGGVAAAGVLAYALFKPAATSAPAPLPQPAPTPAPNPPAPVPVPAPPAPSGNPSIVGALQNGTSYTFALTSSSPGTIDGDLTAAGISGALVTCLSGGICTGSFIWHGAANAPVPSIANATVISLLPALTGLAAAPSQTMKSTLFVEPGRFFSLLLMTPKTYKGDDVSSVLYANGWTTAGVQKLPSGSGAPNVWRALATRTGPAINVSVPSSIGLMILLQI